VNVTEYPGPPSSDRDATARPSQAARTRGASPASQARLAPHSEASRRVRFIYELVLLEKFAQWLGEPEMPITDPRVQPARPHIPQFKIIIEWGRPTHTTGIFTSDPASEVVGSPLIDPAPSGRVPLLHAEPTSRFPNLAAAQTSLEAKLREWELLLDLRDGLAVEFQMRSICASRADGSWEELAWGTGAAGQFTVVRPISDLPALPDEWGRATSPLVDQLRDQWRQVRWHEAKLLDRAYFCVTHIERAYGNGDPAAAAKALKVSRNVLSRIHKLTGSSDPRHARKATRGKVQLEPHDIKFLESAIPRLILRVAEVEGGVPVPSLTQADFDGEMTEITPL
jgi:hypothetical protein